MASAKTDAPKVEIYIAREGFVTGGVHVHSGATVVAGHPLLKGGRMIFFEPFRPSFGQLPWQVAESKGAVKPEPEPEPESKAETAAETAAETPADEGVSS